jgi:hypothetical protein
MNWRKQNEKRVHLSQTKKTYEIASNMAFNIAWKLRTIDIQLLPQHSGSWSAGMSPFLELGGGGLPWTNHL